MNVPSGYSALDLVGFTDKGDYSASANYVKNDLVHYNDKIWKCLIDDTTGIAPTTGVNWDVWIDQSNSLDGLADVEITNAQDGQELSYDGTTQKWKNTSKIQTLTNQIEDMNNVLGAKNLLPNQALDDTWKGITWKVNNDGTLSASGTAEANSIRTIVEAFEIPVGKYILNGCPSGSGLSSYYLDLSVVSGTVTPNYGNDIGEGLAFEVTQTAKITVKARVLSGQTVDITFKPMIRLASITDDTYVPYAMSNRELTESVTNAWIGKPRTGWLNLGNKTTLTITVPITPYGGTYMQGSIKLFGYNNNVLIDCSLAFILSRNNDSVAGSKLSNYSDSAVTLGSIAADGTKVTITLENLTTYVNLQVIYGTSMNGAYVDNTNMPEWTFN